MKTKSLIALASVLALSAGLAACGDKTAQPGDETVAAKDDAAGGSSNLSFDAEGLPQIKPGLWETVHVAGDHTDEAPIRQCLDGFDKEAREQLLGESEGCQKTVSRERGGLRVKAVCSQAGVNTDMTVLLTGNDTENTMAMEMKVDNTADSEAPTTMKSVVKSRWIGACPAGMSPGDLVQDDE